MRNILNVKIPVMLNLPLGVLFCNADSDNGSNQGSNDDISVDKTAMPELTTLQSDGIECLSENLTIINADHFYSNGTSVVHVCLIKTPVIYSCKVTANLVSEGVFLLPHKSHEYATKTTKKQLLILEFYMPSSP
jgi:hypothetical protein